MRPVEPGSVGEVVHRGPTVAAGYWNDPEATRRTFRPNPLRPPGAPDSERVAFTGDLARSDEDGFLHEAPQRVHLSLIDGVVGGEGEGPLAPKPVGSGVLLFGDDVVRTDRAACRLMGFDPARIPLVARAQAPMRFGVAPRADDGEVVFDGRELLERSLQPIVGRSFEPPRGWRRHLASAP